MKSIAGLLCLAVYLLLEVGQGQSFSVTSVEDEGVVQRHMMEDLADLLDAKKREQTQPQMDSDPINNGKPLPREIISHLADLLDEKNKEQNQPQMDNDNIRKYPKLKPGQVILRCSYYTYGCCQDGKTRAKGANREGCGESLCADNYPGYCLREKRRLNCRKGSYDYKMCTHTCNVCPKKLASKLDECMKTRSPFGCCWNGKPALTSNKRDCPRCMDFKPHTCRVFSSISGGCNSGSYGIKSFMQKQCGRTCELCHDGMK